MSRTAIVTLLALLAATGLSSCFDSAMEPDEEVGGAVVWRGFDHLWTHNHRWNRFGSWVERAPGDCEDPTGCWRLAHAAASGTSGDTARFHTAYSRVGARGVGFAAATDHVRLSADFGEALYIRSEELVVPLADLPGGDQLADREQYLVLLNGFDLGSDGPADKPVAFFVEAAEARYDADLDALRVRWRIYLSMDCTSAECWLTARGNDRFDYEVDVHLLVLAADDQLALTFPDRIEREYQWDAPPHILPGSPAIIPVPLGHGSNPDADELDLPPVEGRIDGLAEGGPGLVGLRRLAIQLSPFPGIAGAPADQHMLGWQSAVHPQPVAEGKVDFELDLVFKCWTEGMQRFQITAYPEVGAALMEADLVLVQFPHGASIEHGSWGSEHDWEGGDAPALGEDAVSRSATLEWTP